VWETSSHGKREMKREEERKRKKKGVAKTEY